MLYLGWPAQIQLLRMLYLAGQPRYGCLGRMSCLGWSTQVQIVIQDTVPGLASPGTDAQTGAVPGLASPGTDTRSRVLYRGWPARIQLYADRIPYPG